MDEEALEMVGAPVQTISLCFRHMAIAEEEIVTAQKLYPQKAKFLHAAWYICRSPIVEDAPIVQNGGSAGDKIFRIHCHQMLRYVAEGEPIDRPTRIELGIMVMLGLTYVAPPPDALMALFEGDPETVGAFNNGKLDLEPLMFHPEYGKEYWPEMEQVCKQIYIKKTGHERSWYYKQDVKKYGAEIVEEQGGPREWEPEAQPALF